MKSLTSVCGLICVSLLISATLQQKLSSPLRAAHMLEDCYSTPSNWAKLYASDKDIINRNPYDFFSYDKESLNNNRCKGNRYCNSGRKCSKWGWCQPSDYAGPYYDG